MSAAAAAGLVPPLTDVVAILGSPTGSGQPHAVGTGGLAVTRFKVGRPSTVVFAQAALAGLSEAALQSLAAYELAHVIRTTTPRPRRAFAWLVGYPLLVAAGVGLTLTAMLTASQLAGPALLATTVAVVAFLALRVAVEGRDLCVLTQHPEKPHTYVWVERYRDEEALQTHTEMPSMAEAMNTLPAWWAAPPQMLKLSQVAP